MSPMSGSLKATRPRGLDHEKQPQGEGAQAQQKIMMNPKMGMMPKNIMRIKIPPKSMVDCNP